MKRSLMFAIALYGLGSLAWSIARAQAEPLEIGTGPGMKSQGGAFAYSFLGTALPVGIGTATSLGKNEVSAGVLVALGGGIVGPSLGHFYAHRPGKAIRGILTRGAATGIGWAAIASADRADGPAKTQFLIFCASAVVGAVSLVADITEAPGSARERNEEVARTHATVSPLLGSIEGAPGVGVRVNY